jgi:hypothetical protein
MTRLLASILFACAITLLATATHAGGNLLPNGSLDEGEPFAEHWERPNGLTVEFAKEEGRGRIVVMDTQIDRQQVLQWLKTFAADPDTPVPEKKRLAKGSFATVGGVEGVALDSELIDVEPGQDYKLTADLKGPGGAIVWIKGFMPHPKRDMLVDAYQTRLTPKGASPSAWRTVSIGFNPTSRTPKVARMKVRLYAFWPNGTYYFDNIRVEAISPEEMARLVERRGRK